MDHLSTNRLKHLYRDGVVLNLSEANHLRTCEACSTMLLRFAQLRAKAADLKDKKNLPDRLQKTA
jgi:hypothetical protein